MTSFNKDRSPSETVVHYAPVSDYNYRFQRLDMLEQMGYPINITPISNEDEAIPAAVAPLMESGYVQQKHLDTPEWIKCTTTRSFNRFISLPFFCMQHPFFSTTESVQALLAGHPIQLIELIDRADTSYLYYLHAIGSHEPDIPPLYLAHERSDYRWLQVIEGCIVAAKQQETSHNEALYATISEDAAVLARKLVEAGVKPLNGEQVAGIVSDYYQLVERHFPEFLAFKNSRRRS